MSIKKLSKFNLTKVTTKKDTPVYLPHSNLITSLVEKHNQCKNCHKPLQEDLIKHDLTILDKPIVNIENGDHVTEIYAIYNGYNDIKPTTFVWQLALDENFYHIIDEKTLAYNLPYIPKYLDFNRKYYIRVRAEDISFKSDWSDIKYFYFDSQYTLTWDIQDLDNVRAHIRYSISFTNIVDIPKSIEIKFTSPDNSIVYFEDLMRIQANNSVIPIPYDLSPNTTYKVYIRITGEKIKTQWHYKTFTTTSTLKDDRYVYLLSNLTTTFTPNASIVNYSSDSIIMTDDVNRVFVIPSGNPLFPYLSEVFTFTNASPICISSYRIANENEIYHVDYYTGNIKLFQKVPSGLYALAFKDFIHDWIAFYDSDDDSIPIYYAVSDSIQYSEAHRFTTYKWQSNENRYNCKLWIDTIGTTSYLRLMSFSDTTIYIRGMNLDNDSESMYTFDTGKTISRLDFASEYVYVRFTDGTINIYEWNGSSLNYIQTLSGSTSSFGSFMIASFPAYPVYERLFVGEPDYNSGQGAIHVYRLNVGNFIKTKTITPPSYLYNTGFGSYFTVFRNMRVIMAYLNGYRILHFSF